MKLAKVVSIIFIIALIFLVIIYFVYLENLFNAYAYTQNSIMKYFLSPQLIKPNNKSITVNDTAFELMYYNVSESELTELIHNTNTFTKDIGYLLASIAGLIILYVLYICLYFRVFIRNRNLLPSFIFHSLFPIAVELIIIILIPLSLGLIFYSTIFPILLTFLYALDHLLPLNTAYSMIDSLIFGLDIFLFVVEFLIERVTENEIASIPTTIDKAVKYFHSFNEKLEHVINVGKLAIKILVIITFVISIATTFLAYFNIAYLIEDFYFVFSTMSIITVLVLLVLIAEFLVNISFKGVSYIERLIHRSKTRKSKKP
ncbi:hypothetical protein WIW89_01000 [Stygiolobus sp. CP850M]|uniref:hypothetical protein n=1 Tax=Stygiolobus sp. CP850M TaxID=3133134 RepID=UPI00307F1256